MFFPSIWSDATKTALALYEASTENLRNSQEAMARQVEIASKLENPWHVKWSKAPVPMPYLTFQAKDIEAAREAFHLMADVNLSAWENAAKAYAAMPSWMKASYKVPGEFWSKWFDQFQDGKFDAPFAQQPYSVFSTFMTSTTDVAEPANETVEPAAPKEEAPVAQPTKAEKAEKTVEAAIEEFRLESPPEDDFGNAKPKLLKKPKGKADELTQIKGIGAKLEKTLHDLGVFHFAQIAAWTPENIAWLDDKLAFKGRIYREAWVEQAQNILKAAA